MIIKLFEKFNIYWVGIILDDLVMNIYRYNKVIIRIEFSVY